MDFSKYEETQTDIEEKSDVPAWEEEQMVGWEEEVLEEYEDIKDITSDTWLVEKLKKKREEIREYLKRDSADLSKNFFKKPELESKDASKCELTVNSKLEVEIDEQMMTYESTSIEKRVIKFRAFVCDPFCELSDTVIQLPATPYTSFSLTRFRLLGQNRATVPNYYCDLVDSLLEKRTDTCGKGPFEAWFEFQYLCPHIKLEPQSGYFKEGEVST